ncbi:hypothetical protein G9A89_014378 [Geosiphon pyriformis]|nr:hypothetical protein G9A89_014378 [Geosiphon pyriformis]
MKNELLATIFPFEIDKFSEVLLFSKAALKEKPITAIYTDAKIDIDCTASVRIITANGTTKTPIGEIDDFSIEVNSITVPIKVWVMEAIQY